MLPERLCNNICSLRPNEDKLNYSVIFHIDDKARVKFHQIAHAVINSNRRYTYEEVQAIIERQQRGTNETLPGDNPAVSYATVYPLSMFSRVIIAQIILMFFI
jgi:ribonuclease R